MVTIKFILSAIEENSIKDYKTLFYISFMFKIELLIF